MIPNLTKEENKTLEIAKIIFDESLSVLDITYVSVSTTIRKSKLTENNINKRKYKKSMPTAAITDIKGRQKLDLLNCKS